MVSLIRNGPRSILVETNYMIELQEYLNSNYTCISVDRETMYEKTEEYHTAVHFVEYEDNESLSYKKVDSMVIYEESLTLLCNLFTHAPSELIQSIRPGPHLLVMRATGDLDKVMSRIKTDLGGEFGTFEESTENSSSNITVLGITEKPLNKNMKQDDFYPTYLKIEGNYPKIKRELRMQALNYLNIGIGKKDWNEIEIRIYDSFGAYKLHYDRMMSVLDALELGLVLGESWSKDHPRFMMSVEVYRVRFLTFEDPEVLKEILFGLEYLEDGTRIVDYDLYHKNKKLSWGSLRKNTKDRNRKIESLEIRKKIMDKLDEETIEELRSYEMEILKTRF